MCRVCGQEVVDSYSPPRVSKPTCLLQLTKLIPTSRTTPPPQNTYSSLSPPGFIHTLLYQLCLSYALFLFPVFQSSNQSFINPYDKVQLTLTWGNITFWVLLFGWEFELRAQVHGFLSMKSLHQIHGVCLRFPSQRRVARGTPFLQDPDISRFCLDKFHGVLFQKIAVMPGAK